MILNGGSKVGDVDDGEDVVRPLHGQGDEPGVFDDEDVVLGVGDDGGLVLGDLDTGEAEEVDYCVGDWG